MKLLLTIVLLSASVSACSSESEWLRAAPKSSLDAFERWVQVPRSDFFELPTSKLSLVKSRLSDTSIVQLQSDDPKLLGPAEFSCQNSTRPYLVRASYENSGNGQFSVFWDRSSLIIRYDSLGRGGVTFESALLVCLSKAPESVFSVFSRAI